MNQIVTPLQALPSYLDQSAQVRARFERLKQRESILQVRHLEKVFEQGTRKTVALHDINFSTHRREFLCVIGASGCGKSTLARIIAGLEESSGGEVLLEGRLVDGPGT